MFLMAVASLFLGATVARAADATAEKKFLTRLVWCTDKTKPAGQEMKPVEPKLGDKLKRVLKWKNYFEITRKEVSLPKHNGKRIRVSKRCEFIIKQVGDDLIEVLLFGDGQLAEKTVHPISTLLKKGEHLVIGGDDKDNYGDAWLLVIAAPPKKK